MYADEDPQPGRPRVCAVSPEVINDSRVLNPSHHTSTRSVRRHGSESDLSARPAGPDECLSAEGLSHSGSGANMSAPNFTGLGINDDGGRIELDNFGTLPSQPPQFPNRGSCCSLPPVFAVSAYSAKGEC